MRKPLSDKGVKRKFLWVCVSYMQADKKITLDEKNAFPAKDLNINMGFRIANTMQLYVNMLVMVNLFKNK